MSEKEKLVRSYDSLTTSDKRKELGREIAEITIVTEKLLSDINPNYSIKSMDDYNNLFEESTPEDKYLTGLYEDVIELKEELGIYFEKVTGTYYEDEISDNISINTSGYTKIGILALVSTLVSIGIIVLGTFLTK